MRTNPCKHCPFRKGSKMGYDADAMEALDDGSEPSCHAIVGQRKAFYAVLPENAIACLGHSAWLEAAPGFCRPKIIERLAS